MKKLFAWALAGAALVAAGSASATTCSNAAFKQLQWESSDTGTGQWQTERDDSPLDPNTARIILHVLLQDFAGSPFPYDYIAFASNCTGIERKPLSQVRNLSFDFMNETGQPVHNGAGSPAIRVLLDTDGNGTWDDTATLAASYCPAVLLEDPTWSRADFTGRVAPGCLIWLNSNGTTPASQSDGVDSAWKNLADLYPAGRVVSAFFILDETGTAFVDRVAWHSKMYIAPGSGSSAIKNCPSEASC